MTIFGSDVSHYDAADTRRMFAEGIVFQTHKAGGDSTGGDGELAAWWGFVRGTDPASILLGTYWVPRPDLYLDPAREADRWIATLDARCPGWRLREHILQMDAEIWNGDPRTKPGKTYLQKLGLRLVELMPRLMPICYASAGQYGDSLAGLSFPLWNARYPLDRQTGTAAGLYTRCGGDSGKGWNAYSGKVPAVWQYTSSATIGGQSTCDANAFRGTLDQLKRLVAPGWAQEVGDMPLTDADADKVADKVWGRMFTRPDGPDSHGNTQTSAGAYQAYSDVQPQVAADRVIATLAPLIKGMDVDEAAIAQAVLKGLPPAALSDAVVAALQALPEETAKATADEIAARMSA